MIFLFYINLKNNKIRRYKLINIKLFKCSSIIFNDNNFLSLKYLELDIEEKELIIKSSISRQKMMKINFMPLKKKKLRMKKINNH